MHGKVQAELSFVFDQLKRNEKVPYLGFAQDLPKDLPNFNFDFAGTRQKKPAPGWTRKFNS
jgi:hypothetical protein